MAVRKQEVHEDDQHITQAEKRSRITFDVSPELKRRIKLAALQNDVSIGEYLGRILEQSVPDEMQMMLRKKRIVPNDILEQLNQVREQVIHESKGYIFEDSAEVIRQQREERSLTLERTLQEHA